VKKKVIKRKMFNSAGWRGAHITYRGTKVTIHSGFSFYKMQSGRQWNKIFKKYVKRKDNPTSNELFIENEENI
jgi:hypothetical protein